MTEKDKETIVCMSCLAPNESSVDFCYSCSAPLGTTSTLDPMKAIRAEGFLLQKATSERPKLMVVLGVWILFLPWIVGIIVMEINLILNYWDGFPSLIFFWIGVALFLAALKILFTVTKNYLKLPDKQGSAK